MSGQSPELRALLKQMEAERKTFDNALHTLQNDVTEVRVAALNVLQCATAIGRMAEKQGDAGEGGALQ